MLGSALAIQAFGELPKWVLSRGQSERQETRKEVRPFKRCPKP
jgi:hypothetical protein